MEKVFKYSIVALESTEHEETYEILHQDSILLQTHDHIVCHIGQADIVCEIEAISKVNHILTPNDQFDYRIIAVALK